MDAVTLDSDIATTSRLWVRAVERELNQYGKVFMESFELQDTIPVTEAEV